jgi:hypothetical protein
MKDNEIPTENINHEPNDKTKKILLDENNYSKKFDNLEDLFSDLEN